MPTNTQEFVERARKMLNDEYTRAHTAEYNTWLSNHKNAWMQPHIVVPFPPFVVNSALLPFKPTVSKPTEDDVVARALDLYTQENKTDITTPVAANNTEPPQVVEVETTVEPVIEPAVVIEEKPAEPDIVEETKPISGKLLSPTVVSTDSPLIRDIFRPIDDPIFKDTTLEKIKQDLSVVPQPSEELSKVVEPEKPATFFQKLKDKWITK